MNQCPPTHHPLTHSPFVGIKQSETLHQSLRQKPPSLHRARLALLPSGGLNYAPWGFWLRSGHTNYRGGKKTSQFSAGSWCARWLTPIRKSRNGRGRFESLRVKAPTQSPNLVRPAYPDSLHAPTNLAIPDDWRHWCVQGQLKKIAKAIFSGSSLYGARSLHFAGHRTRPPWQNRAGIVPSLVLRTAGVPIGSLPR